MGVKTAVALARIASAPTGLVGPATALTTFAEENRTWEGVATPPAELAAAAGLPLGSYVLARNVRSEEGRSSPAHRLAIAELARNKALATNVSVAWLLTSRVARGWEFTAGKVGRQNGRWAATTLAPRRCDVVAATIALYEQSALLPAKAVKYYDPAAQDARSGKAYTDRVLAKWTSEGCEWIGPVRVGGVEVIDPYGLMCFAEGVRGPDPAAAAEMIRRGRAGERVDAGGNLKRLLGVAGTLGTIAALVGKVWP